MTQTDQRITASADVLVQEIDGQSALLNLKTERYFGLDDVGTEIWKAVTSAGTVAEAIERLLDVYDVDADTLRADVLALLQRLEENGLIQIDA